MTIVHNTTTSPLPFRDKSQDRLRVAFRATGPASYATGGDLIDKNALGLTQIHEFPNVFWSNGTVVIGSFYVPSTGKLKFFDMAGAEIANATDLSTYGCTLEVSGH